MASETVPIIEEGSERSGVLSSLRSSSERALQRSREKLLTVVEADTKRVVAFQEYCGVRMKDQSLKYSSPELAHEGPPGEAEKLSTVTASFHEATYTKAPILLDIIFQFGAGLGNELFYILFLPNFIWTVNYRLGRRLVLMWVMMYYVGQLLKDLMKLPRPPSPPVVRLETHYSMEYGLPSTHAMAAASIPFFLAYSLTPENWYSGSTAGEQSLFGAVVLLWLLAFSWFSTMTVSRLYMGVHSVVDVQAGMALGLISLGTFLVIGESLDEFFMTTQAGGAAVVIIGIALVLAYYFITRPPKWTPCYGDTALIVAVGIGAVLGNRLLYADDPGQYFDEISPTTVIPRLLSHSTATGARPMALGDWAMMFVARSLVAYALLLLARTVSKFVVGNLVEMVLPASSAARKERYEVEIPTKLVTYSLIGFLSAGVIKPLFQFYGWWYPV